MKLLPKFKTKKELWDFDLNLSFFFGASVAATASFILLFVNGYSDWFVVSVLSNGWVLTHTGPKIKALHKNRVQ